MRAVVFVGQGRIRVEDVPKPEVADAGDAVVRVSLSSICGSDLHLLDGHTPGMEEGSVIGHEFVGVIEATGPGVEGHAPGDRVLGSFLIACGACPECEERRFNFCRNRRALGQGSFTGNLDGAQAEFVRVPTADLNLRRLDGDTGDLTDEQVLFGGDVLTTGFYAASLTEAAPDEKVVVIGAGPIGLFTAAALKDAGVDVVLLDRDPQRVAFAEGRGHSARLVKEDDPSPLVRDAFSGDLAHAAVDAVGSIPALKSSFRCVREGGRVVVVGVYGAERMELALGRAWISGLDLRFSGMANIQGHWDDALDAVARGTIDPTRLITHRLPLDEAEKGYELFAAREATKVVLMP